MLPATNVTLTLVGNSWLRAKRHFSNFSCQKSSISLNTVTLPGLLNNECGPQTAQRWAQIWVASSNVNLFLAPDVCIAASSLSNSVLRLFKGG